MARVFDKKNIILAKVQDEDLNSFLINFDIDDSGKPHYQLDEFTKAIINTIPEYVFAHYENPDIPNTDAVDKLREAARSIYKINDFDLMRRWYLDRDKSAYEQLEASSSKNRGEFGELILHLLLRDFKATIPLVSKVYFKDASGVSAHGFDAVHISPNERILWLGESKFYQNSKRGLTDLLKDLSDHFKSEYLEEQFTIIKKNLSNNGIPQRDEWITILNSCNQLKDRIDMIYIPMLCTYPNNIYEVYSNLECTEATSYHETNVRKLKEYFDSNNHHALKDRLNIILFLFPIRDKQELVRRLHERLWHMQEM